MVNVENVKNNHLPSFGLDMMQVMLITSNGIMRNNEGIQYFNGNVEELLHKDHFKKKMKNLDKEQGKLDLSLKFMILKIIHEHVFFVKKKKKLRYIFAVFQVFINMSMLFNTIEENFPK